jgi:putative aldouronate transport system permease protein
MQGERSKQKRVLSTFKANRQLLMLSLPGAIWFLLFAYLPMFGVIVAFKKFRLSGGFIESLVNSKWCGFDNFRFLFYSGDMWIVFRNTICYNLVFIILGIVLPIIVALMLNEVRKKSLAKFYQSSMFLPYFLSWVVVSYFLFTFLNPDKGLVNGILQGMGKDAVAWYSEKKYWPFIIVFVSQWKGIGYNTVVYLAAICGIDKTYFEAAVIDGATKWQQIKYITIPLMKPVITILFILSVGRIFSADFGLFYQIPKNSGALFDYTNVLDTYVYRALMTSGEFGMSSAASLFQSTIGFILIMVANKVVSIIDSDNALF